MGVRSLSSPNRVLEAHIICTTGLRHLHRLHLQRHLLPLVPPRRVPVPLAFGLHRRRSRRGYPDRVPLPLRHRPSVARRRQRSHLHQLAKDEDEYRPGSYPRAFMASCRRAEWH